MGVVINSIFIVAKDKPQNINYIPSEPIPIPTKPKIEKSLSLAFSPNLGNKKKNFNTY
jgi:hypothetical protein